MSPLLRDRLGSLLMLAFVASLWVQRDYMSPLGGMFPDTIMVLVVVFVGLSLILSFVRGAGVLTADSADSADKTPVRIDYLALQRVLVVVILLSLWVGLYRFAGFALTGTLGFAGIAWYLSEHRRAGAEAIRALVVGAAATFVVYMVFDYFLQVPLPAGFLFD